MIDPTLCRRVEEASLNAWPALQQSLLDGWVLRFSRGFTKRANSIVPLYPSQQTAIEKIRYCENLYSRERLKTIFRLTTVMEAASLDALLEQRGYQHVDPTRVLVCELEGTSFAVETAFHEVPRDAWLDAYAGAADVPPAGQQLHAMLLAGIRSEHVFGFISPRRSAGGVRHRGARTRTGRSLRRRHAADTRGGRVTRTRWSNRCSRGVETAAPGTRTCKWSRRTTRPRAVPRARLRRSVPLLVSRRTVSRQVACSELSRCSIGLIRQNDFEMVNRPRVVALQGLAKALHKTKNQAHLRFDVNRWLSSRRSMARRLTLEGRVIHSPVALAARRSNHVRDFGFRSRTETGAALTVLFGLYGEAQ